MRWLHNITFSSTPSSSYSTSSPNRPLTSSSSYSSSSAAAVVPDDSTSPTKKLTNRKKGNIGGVSFGGGARLTRQRKLRHLTDQDVAGPRLSADSADMALMSRCVSSSALPGSLKTSTSVPLPLPLPLPLPVPENSVLGDADSRLPSPIDVDRERDRADGAGEAVSPTISPASSGFGGRDMRRMVDHLETKPSKMVLPELSTLDCSYENMRLNIPRSAPNSPFASPVRSPQRISNVPELRPFYLMPKASQGCSATETLALDMPALLPSGGHFEYGAYSNESSPLHSPQNRSPRWNPRSPTRPGSPLNTKLSAEASTARRETTVNLEVHPLPLPPGATAHSTGATVYSSGAALQSLSTVIPQVIARQPESTPLKGQWQKGKLIGRGTFGSVYVASNRETGALCAMKEAEICPDDPKSAECIKQLQQEIKLLSHLKHPNIVQYYGSEIVGDHFYIYLEYVHPGSINRYVREHCGAITESVVRSFTRHILSGLAFLHSTKTIHRDIKGANLLVDASGVVKLADFGMAKHLSGHAAELSLKGSPYWMAPELMQAVMQKETNSDLALAVDIWSLGCTIIEMFTGKPPWSEYEGAAAMFKVMRDSPPIPQTLSPEGKDFLRCCFLRNPAERPTASKLLEHWWLKNSPQIDVPHSTTSSHATKLIDMPLSPQSADMKLDQFPLFTSSKITKGKLPSESCYLLLSFFICHKKVINYRSFDIWSTTVLYLIQQSNPLKRKVKIPPLPTPYLYPTISQRKK
ncbi:hypothetical protein K2173_005974 [Erythroxylum novogranatense]|uniref:mitogen-activated protein kinase kinase kinase n=1 Tax=Erythroxylum novogranatense TaxID=1862640 RepID=A0AAV8TE04_9ROSI|nr:hypothetical protein K2173_005974 [Erythroxylum novogranatense]